MADFGFTEALAGFLSSSNEKSSKSEQLALLQQFESYKHQRAQQNFQAEKEKKTYYDVLDKYTTEIIKQTGIRDKDKEQFKLITDEARQFVEQEIRNSGGELRFMQSGGNQKLKAYYNSIVNNELFVRLNKNKEVLKKIVDASQDPKQAKLIPINTLNQLDKYQNGEIDELKWDGMLGEYDEEMYQNVPRNTPITAEIILQDPINRQIAMENFEKDMGKSKEDYVSPEVYEVALSSYLDNKNKLNYGTGKIVKTVSEELYKGYLALDDLTKTGYRQDQDIKSEFRNSVGYDIIDKSIGIDATWTTGKEDGNRIKNVGQIGGAYTDMIAQEIFGSKFVNGRVTGMNKDWFIGGTGEKLDEWALTEGYKIGDGSGVKITGFTMGLKLSGTVNGEYKEMLVVEGEDLPSDMEDLEGKTTEVVYLAEGWDLDTFDDDYYYYEIPSDVFQRAVDTKLNINAKLSAQSAEQFDYDKEKKREEQRVERQISDRNIILDAFAGNPDDFKDEEGGIIIDQLYGYYGTALEDKSKLLGIKEGIVPSLFTYLMMEADKIGGEDAASYAYNSIQNLEKLSNTEKGRELLEIIQHGNQNNFYLWLQNQGLSQKDIEKYKKIAKATKNTYNEWKIEQNKKKQ